MYAFDLNDRMMVGVKRATHTISIPSALDLSSITFFVNLYSIICIKNNFKFDMKPNFIVK